MLHGENPRTPGSSVCKSVLPERQQACAGFAPPGSNDLASRTRLLHPCGGSVVLPDSARLPGLLCPDVPVWLSSSACFSLLASSLLASSLTSWRSRCFWRCRSRHCSSRLFPRYLVSIAD